MATEAALLPCKNTDDHGIKSGYPSFLAGKKRAQGINIEKPVIISLDDDDEKILGHKDNMDLEKKKSVCIDKEPRLVSSSNRIKELISGCGIIYEYKCLNRISHGSYGTVYRARHAKTGEIVAVKKESHGLSKSSLTEINILRSLDHPSIVKYKQVVTDNYDSVYVVMEYLEYDLREYIGDTTKRPYISLPEIKRLMKELLEGVVYLHKNRVMHRDLKPSNILINSEGKLKICDFGMSRLFPTMGDATTCMMSSNVGTLWYKAPELLLGTLTYSSAIDMWSVGCIMAELFMREALFKRDSELEQIKSIVRTLQQPRNQLYQKLAAVTMLKGYPFLTEVGFDLLCRLLAYDPNKRITAEDALNHVWFEC